MKNKEIIAKVAIKEGILTEKEVNALVSSGKDIPLHTLQGWKKRGNFRIRKGEHGIETKLWKLKPSVSKDAAAPKEFYLAKAFLFRQEQVEEYAKC